MGCFFFPRVLPRTTFGSSFLSKGYGRAWDLHLGGKLSSYMCTLIFPSLLFRPQRPSPSFFTCSDFVFPFRAFNAPIIQPVLSFAMFDRQRSFFFLLFFFHRPPPHNGTGTMSAEVINLLVFNEASVRRRPPWKDFSRIHASR